MFMDIDEITNRSFMKINIKIVRIYYSIKSLYFYFVTLINVHPSDKDHTGFKWLTPGIVLGILNHATGGGNHFSVSIRGDNPRNHRRSRKHWAMSFPFITFFKNLFNYLFIDMKNSPNGCPLLCGFRGKQEGWEKLYFFPLWFIVHHIAHQFRKASPNAMRVASYSKQKGWGDEDPIKSPIRKLIACQYQLESKVVTSSDLDFVWKCSYRLKRTEIKSLKNN